MENNTSKNSPAKTSGAYDKMFPLWEICRDVMAGTRRMREAGEKYLPKNIGEKNQGYQRRLQRTILFNAFKKTLEGMAGMVFRKEPSLSDDMPEKIKEHMQNVDLAGTDLNSFAINAFDQSLQTGLYHVLVDHQNTKDAKTRQDEIKAGARPYWVGIKPENLISWRTVIENGQIVLDQIVIKEEVVEADGEFGEKTVIQYRVWTRKTWRLLQVKEDDSGKEAVVEIENGEHTFGSIPLVTFNFNPQGFMIAAPPMLDLAEENVGHWQATAGHKSLLNIVSVAILLIKGRNKDDVGKDIAWANDATFDLPKDGSAEFLEHEGKALSATRLELKDSEERMTRMGLSMVAEGDVDIKATKLKFDKSESDSLISRFAKELDRGVNQCIEFQAKWLKIENGGTYSTNKDFESRALSAEQVKQLTEMVSSGKLSLETMWSLLIKGEWLPENFDYEEEQRRIDQEGNGNEEELEDGRTEEEEELEPTGSDK